MRPAKGRGAVVSPETFFEGHDRSRPLFHAVSAAVARIGPAALSVTRSQIAFRRRRAFAWVWIPGRYLKGQTPPLVLSLVLTRRDPSPRWKEIAALPDGRFMHHLELRTTRAIDDAVVALLAEAWAAAA
ncbi:MAG TPA: DUF5655 domain-containing protein [Caulobacter sp.]|nr:DUF5655 domain-containing protein [Caulobacter sp.]